MEDYITSIFNWLNLEDYQFKILILVKMLATDKEQLTYKGKLEDMRNWLDLGNSTANNTKIRNAIQELYKKGIIDYTPKSDTATKYTITIIDKIEDEKLIHNVNKKWIDTVRNYNIDNNKKIIGNMLKVLLYAYDNINGIARTKAEISELLNLTDNQITNAINNLQCCHFQDYSFFYKDYEKEYFGKSKKITGTILQFNANAFYNNY